jgi:hypothetical protein
MNFELRGRADQTGDESNVEKLAMKEIGFLP